MNDPYDVVCGDVVAPYFTQNKDWYTVEDWYENGKERNFRLTDKAPPKAVKSFKEFYKQMDKYASEGIFV